RRLDRRHTRVVDANPGGGGLFPDLDAEASGRLGEADGRGEGVAPTVLGAEGAAVDVVQDEVGIDPGDFVRRHPPRRDAEAMLEGEILAEDRFFRRVGEQEEITLLPQADVLPEPLVEALPNADAVGREADVRLGRKLLPDAAGGV